MSAVALRLAAFLSAAFLFGTSGAAVALVAFAVTAAVEYWVNRRGRIPLDERRAILVTGCDSGLGFSLATHLHARGCTVLAGCLRPDGPGATRLLQDCGARRLHVIPLDVTEPASVTAAVRLVDAILAECPGLELAALINNAGVMVFGEFEWQTERLIKQQVDVNLVGTVRVTKALCPLLRRYRGRVITVTSHCALATLPGLAIYGGTKAALRAWSDGLRVEQAKHGVAVVTVIPGSFTQDSNILARHGEHVQQMWDAMSEEDRAQFGDYFSRYHKYLSQLSRTRPPARIRDERMHDVFEQALTARRPAAHYEHGPMRYSVYHLLFRVSPWWLRDWLVQRFVSMPRY